MEPRDEGLEVLYTDIECLISYLWMWDQSISIDINLFEHVGPAAILRGVSDFQELYIKY